MKPRSGLSSVYGFIIIFTLLMAGIGASLTIMDSQASVWNAQDRARQISANQRVEHLALSLNGTSLSVQNVGLIPSHLLYLFQKGSTTSADRRIDATVSEGSNLTLAVSSGMSSFAVITSLGNVFWASNSSQALAQPSSVSVTFDASGLDSGVGTATVLTVDGLGYAYSSIPKTFEWAPGSLHNYSYAEGFASGPGSRTGWSYARGLASSMSAPVTASQTGSIVSVYTQQYLPTATGGNALQYVNSPSNDGWYNSGSNAQVSIGYAWNSVAAQSRQNLVSYSLDGSTAVGVPRAGSGTYTTPPIAMNSPHAVAFAAVTQYALNANGGDGMTFTGSQTGDGWFDSGSAGKVTTNYAWNLVSGQSRSSLLSWNLDGGANQAVTREGSGTFTTTSVSMNTFHAVSFNSVTQYYLAIQNSVPSNGTAESLTVSYSYTGSSSAPWSASQDVCTGCGQYAPAVIPQPSSSWSITSISWSNSVGQSGASGDSLTFHLGASSPSIGTIYSAQYACSSGCSGSWSYSFGAGVSFTAYFEDNMGCTQVHNGDASPVYCGTTFTISPSGSYAATSPVSGSTSSAPNAFSVTGATVTYTYGVGYDFPSGATSTSWSATWPSGESYSSTTCLGAGTSGNTLSSGTGGACTLTTTHSGSFGSSIGASPTGDGWYDSGSTPSISCSPTGPFSFASWSTSSGNLVVASATSASTTVSVGTYGTITASIGVGQ